MGKDWKRRDSVEAVVDALEGSFDIIRAEWAEAVRLMQGNPNRGMFFQTEKELLAEKAGSWREFELWRGGFELKYCGVFKQTCEIMRKLPE